MKLFFVLILTSFSVNTIGQSKTFRNAAGLPTPNGYSHSVEIDLGKSKMVILSGQVGLNRDGKTAGLDMRSQTRQVFENIQTILKDAGGNLNDLVKIGIFTTDLSKINDFRQVRDQFIDLKHPPASSLVEVKGLRKELLIEVEATAIIAKP